MGKWSPATILRKLMERVEFEPNTGCWLWSGQEREGYGRVSNGGQWTGAHRMSYRLHRGDIPDGLVVRHKCDTPACINPDHLTLGTQADNINDRDQRGRTGRTMGKRGEGHWNAKLSVEDVQTIRRERAAGARTVELAARYGVATHTINRASNGKRWSVVGEPS